jgi:hypothetical protein
MLGGPVTMGCAQICAQTDRPVQEEEKDGLDAYWR